MTEEEVTQFIASQKSLQVATINKDGTPHLSTLWFDVVNGEIVFETFTKSQKSRISKETIELAVFLKTALFTKS